MVDAKVFEAVNYLSARIRESGIHIDNLILFGSSSTGTARPGSGIDIATISGDFSGRDIFDRALLTRDAELNTIRKFRVPLDILTLIYEELADPASPIAGTLRKAIVLRQASPAQRVKGIMKCVNCRQETREGTTNVTFERDGMTLVLRGVPAQVCSDCGEDSVDGQVAREIFGIGERMAKSAALVDIRRYVSGSAVPC